jgi:hypothetical protein
LSTAAKSHHITRPAEPTASGRGTFAGRAGPLRLCVMPIAAECRRIQRRGPACRRRISITWEDNQSGAPFGTDASCSRVPNSYTGSPPTIGPTDAPHTTPSQICWLLAGLSALSTARAAVGNLNHDLLAKKSHRQSLVTAIPMSPTPNAFGLLPGSAVYLCLSCRSSMHKRALNRATWSISPHRNIPTRRHPSGSSSIRQ